MSDSNGFDPQRRAFIRQLLEDPAGARREMRERERAFWLDRVEQTRSELAAAESRARGLYGNLDPTARLKAMQARWTLAQLRRHLIQSSGKYYALLNETEGGRA